MYNERPLSKGAIVSVMRTRDNAEYQIRMIVPCALSGPFCFHSAINLPLQGRDELEKGLSGSPSMSLLSLVGNV